MIKHLENLKVKAIAVKVPEGYQCKMWSDKKILSCLENTIGNSSGKKYIELPHGEWVIIGRADIGETADVFSMDYEDWQSYCNEHNLANELILCEL